MQLKFYRPAFKSLVIQVFLESHIAACEVKFNVLMLVFSFKNPKCTAAEQPGFELVRLKSKPASTTAAAFFANVKLLQQLFGCSRFSPEMRRSRFWTFFSFCGSRNDNLENKSFLKKAKKRENQRRNYFGTL